MVKNDVITVVAMSGEYVGKLKDSGAGTITLADPRMLVHNEHGMGFANGIAVTGKNEPTEVTFQTYVFATPTNDEVEKAYIQAVSGLVI
jgi:hypothetical protein